MKLYRSTRDKRVFGLCGGLAEVFKIDVTVLRLIVVLGTFFSGGAVLLLYILAALVIPKEQSPHDGTAWYGSGSSGSWNDGQPTGFGPTGPTGPNPGMFQSQTPPRQDRSSDSKLDDMMKDIERKALLKEIEELKARLAKLEQEKNEKGDE